MEPFSGRETGLPLHTSESLPIAAVQMDLSGLFMIPD